MHVMWLELLAQVEELYVSPLFWFVSLFERKMLVLISGIFPLLCFLQLKGAKIPESDYTTLPNGLK